MNKSKQTEIQCWNCCWFEPDKDKESTGECVRLESKENKKHIERDCDDWCYYFSSF